jgi:predicted outer membrane repeat protein
VKPAAPLSRFTWACIVLASACGGSGGPPAPLECVDNICPCNEGGIRGAIAQGPGTYTFDCEEPTTITTSQEIELDEDVVLDGRGLLTVDGGQRHRVFSVPSDRTVGLVGLAIINGNETDEHGGGVRNEGTLTVESCTLSGNNAGRAGGCRTNDLSLLCSEGGAIWNTGTLTVSATTMTGNSAHFGGAIGNRAGATTVLDAEIIGNLASGCRGVGAVVCSGGGGVWNSATLTMENTRVEDSTADWGAALYTRAAATLTRCTFLDNAAGFDGGGALNFETLELVATSFDGNTAGQNGGGIANPSPGVLSVTTSTLSNNQAASAGGGVYNPSGASAAMMSSTLSSNTAETGGGIYTGGNLELRSSTLASNQASTASALFGTSSLDAERVVALSLIDGDCAGALFESGGYNVEGPGDTCGLDDVSDETAASGLELEPLRDNGGPTETHALGASSIAVDFIPEGDCVDGVGDPLETDQRSEPRPAGAGCDAGAFETQL